MICLRQSLNIHDIHEFIESIQIESIDNQQEENLKSSISELIIKNRVPVSHACSLLNILRRWTEISTARCQDTTWHQLSRWQNSFRTKVQTTHMRQLQQLRYCNFHHCNSLFPPAKRFSRNL